MKVIVGLGNPGSKYENTRHNVGFDVVDRLAGGKSWGRNKSGLLEYCHIKIGDNSVELIKPLTYMNKSGDAVARVVKKHSVALENLWMVHDDLDIRLGDYKIQKGRGPKDHRGVESVERCLGSKDFWRVRVGVDSRHREVLNPKSETRNHSTSRYVAGKSQIQKIKNRNKNTKIPGEKYVLMKLGKEEREIFDKVIERIVNDLIDKFDV